MIKWYPFITLQNEKSLDIMRIYWDFIWYDTTFYTRNGCILWASLLRISRENPVITKPFLIRKKVLWSFKHAAFSPLWWICEIVIKPGLLENGPLISPNKTSIQFGDFPASHVWWNQRVPHHRRYTNHLVAGQCIRDIVIQRPVSQQGAAGRGETPGGFRRSVLSIPLVEDDIVNSVSLFWVCRLSDCWNGFVAYSPKLALWLHRYTCIRHYTCTVFGDKSIVITPNIYEMRHFLKVIGKSSSPGNESR